MLRYQQFQRILGARQFNITAAIYRKGSSASTITEELPQMHGQPSIYNKKRSMSNVDGYRKAKVAPGLYIQPAQASPTGSIHSETIPLSFLPPGDPRRIKVLPHLDKVQQESTLGPPVLTGQYKEEKSYHLTPEEVQEIIKLRQLDPEKYTRAVLAKKFGVSRLFVSLVSSASEERLQEMNSRLNIIQARWRKGRKEARMERVKRHQTWYRDL